MAGVIECWVAADGTDSGIAVEMSGSGPLSSPGDERKATHRAPYPRCRHTVQVKSLHIGSSEFVTSPQFEIVDVAARRCFFQKLPGVKNSVVGLKPGVTVNLPTRFYTRPITHEPCTAVAGWNEQKSRNGIHT